MEKQLALKNIKNAENLLYINFCLPNDIKMNIRCNIIDEVNSNLSNNLLISREDQLFAKKLGKYSEDNKILFTECLPSLTRVH